MRLESHTEPYTGDLNILRRTTHVCAQCFTGQAVNTYVMVPKVLWLAVSGRPLLCVCTVHFHCLICVLKFKINYIVLIVMPFFIANIDKGGVEGRGGGINFNVWKKRRERSKIVGTDFFQDLVIANNLAIGFCICQLMLACHFFCAKISAQYMLGGISKIKLHHSRFEEKKDSWIPVGTVM